MIKKPLDFFTKDDLNLSFEEFTEKALKIIDTIVPERASDKTKVILKKMLIANCEYTAKLGIVLKMIHMIQFDAESSNKLDDSMKLLLDMNYKKLGLLLGDDESQDDKSKSEDESATDFLEAIKKIIKE